MRTKETEREEVRTKIRMVMEANGTPMTVKEINEHPTMTDVSGHMIGQLMRHMPGIRFGKGKRWSMFGKKTKIRKPKRGSKNGVARGPYKKSLTSETNGFDGSGAQFRITKEGTLFLSINGVSFPVEVE